MSFTVERGQTLCILGRSGVGKSVAVNHVLVGEAGVDLLVTGSHGHGFLGDLLFGATTSLRPPRSSVERSPRKAARSTNSENRRATSVTVWLLIDGSP